MYLLMALGAAALFAVSTVLKHRSARGVGTADTVAGAGLRDVVRRTVRHPAWITGIAVDVGALALQVGALHLGPIAAVQPVLAVSVVLALVLDHRRVPGAVWGWVALLVAALIGFVLLSGTATAVTAPDAEPTLICCLVVAAVIAACLTAARRLRAGLVAATALGLGVGIVYAASAALLKVLSNHAVQRGTLALLGSWQLYAVIICGAAGVLLNQLAFSAGPLRHSLPTIAAVDPVASVAIGAVVFDQRFRLTSASGIAQLLALAVVVAAVVRIGRVQVARMSECVPVAGS